MGISESIIFNIHSNMEKRGISKEQLAKSIGVTIPILEKHFCGEIAFDSSMLCDIANYFNVNYDYLIESDMYKKKY